MLRLAVEAAGGRPDQLSDAVLARVSAGPDEESAVVLMIEGDPPVDAAVRESLNRLDRELAGRDLRMYLVAGNSQLREYLATAGPKKLAVHPTMRAAVLASYADLSGPGLVTGSARAALTAPVELLALTPRE